MNQPSGHYPSYIQGSAFSADNEEIARHPRSAWLLRWRSDCLTDGENEPLGSGKTWRLAFCRETSRNDVINTVILSPYHPVGVLAEDNLATATPQGLLLCPSRQFCCLLGEDEDEMRRRNTGAGVQMTSASSSSDSPRRFTLVSRQFDEQRAFAKCSAPTSPTRQAVRCKEGE